MVLVNLSEVELRNLVDKYFKDEETDELLIKSFETSRRIVEIYCNLSEETRKQLYFFDYLAFNVELYDSIEEAIEDHVNLEKYEIIEDYRRHMKEKDRNVVLVGNWDTTLL